VVLGAVFAVALTALALADRNRDRDTRLDQVTAVQSALRNVEVARATQSEGYTRTRVLRLDDELTRVTFFDGPRVIVEAAVGPDGAVRYLQVIGSDYVRAGSRTAQEPVVLLALAALFALLTASVPLRSLRNLDILALLAIALVIHLLNERLFELSTLVAIPPLAYLTWRCLRRGFSTMSRIDDRSCEPLVTVLLSRIDRSAARRVGAISLAGIVAGFAIIAIPGGQTGDVGFASLAGATALLDGELPYGNVGGGIVHGDTYPLLAYVAYLPGALISPVRDVFDNAESALWIATAAALLAAWAIWSFAARAGGGGGNRHEGPRVAAAWLAYPPVLITASSGSNDMVAAALMAGAVAAIAHSGRSTAALSAAAWVKLLPVLLLPAWIAQYRSRGLRGAVFATLIVTLPLLAVLLALGGADGVREMLEAISWQAGRGTNLSVWSIVELPALQVLFQALVVTLAAAVTLAVWQNEQLRNDPRRLCALAAGVIVLAQLAGNYWTYAYVVWALPLIAAALLGRPSSQAAA
jgi:hypothetical protein